MHMREKTAKTAGQNYTAQEDVRLMHIMQQVQSEVFMSQDVNYLENVWSVQS